MAHGYLNLGAQADEYRTLTTGQSTTLQLGETALITFVGGAFQTTPITYQPSGGATTSMDLRYTGAVPYNTAQANTSACPDAQSPIPLVGPATITVVAGVANRILGMKVVKTVTAAAQSNDQAGTPSNAVVIPADATGPVQVVLESSTDLITWTGATPGSYGTSTTKRFFRVRAVTAGG